MRRVVAIVALIGLAIVVCLFLLLPTTMVAFGGGFRWREVHSEHSPDGRFQVVVLKRTAFPANEWVDPSVVIRAELREVTSRRVLASGRAALMEDSDFSAPRVEWRSDEVYITEFDDRKHQTITLRKANKITGPNAGGRRQFVVPAPPAARVGQFWR